MKKTVVLIVALLSCFLAYSQEASDAGLSGELLIVPRLEFNPYIYTDGSFDYDLGSTGLYSLFEGTLGDHVSFSICNLWANESPKYLYTESFNPNVTTWVNWAYVTLSFGNFFADLGKKAILYGTFEQDEYDYNNYWGLCTYVWNNFQTYQWGAAAGWRNEDETTKFTAQVTSGVAGRWPFTEGITATVQAYHEFSGNSILMAAVNYYNQGNGYYYHGGLADLRYFMASAGYQQSFGDATVTLDAYAYNRFREFNTSAMLSFKYDFEKLDLTARAGMDSLVDEDGLRQNAVLVGGLVQYYPLRESKDLRLHCMAAYNNCPTSPIDNHFNFTVGATYFFNIKVF